MVKLFLMIVFGMAISVVSIGWLAWTVLLRGIAVRRGWVPPTAYDYLVLAWEAERESRWTDARTAYDEAVRLEPDNRTAWDRRQAFLERDEYAEESAGF